MTSEDAVTAKPLLPLTQRQARIMDFLRKFIAEWGYPPTRRELMDHFAWKSTNAAVVHLRLIEQKGYIVCDERVARGIRIL